MGRRKAAQAANKQGTLLTSGFFDASAGGGTYAPRKRQAYSSKRLQQVVSDFRKEQRARLGNPSGSEGGAGSRTRGGSAEIGDIADAEEMGGATEKRPRKRQKKTAVEGEKRPPVAKRGGRSTRRSASGTSKKKGKRKAQTTESDDDDDGDWVGDDGVAPAENSDGDVHNPSAASPEVGLSRPLRPRPKPRFKVASEVGLDPQTAYSDT